MMQKMVALKKAYADIILNTAKEAAARIMVSERKALRFQQDLFASKEESLRMLVRVKQMIDSKVFLWFLHSLILVESCVLIESIFWVFRLFTFPEPIDEVEVDDNLICIVRKCYLTPWIVIFTSLLQLHHVWKSCYLGISNLRPSCYCLVMLLEVSFLLFLSIYSLNYNHYFLVAIPL